MLGLGADVTSGSSPLTRGKPADREPPADRMGLIPAHAGKTFWRSTLAAFLSAHPRSRGENFAVGPGGGEARGSSPLTRGKHYLNSTTKRVERLIPAHAGKTYRGG